MIETEKKVILQLRKVYDKIQRMNSKLIENSSWIESDTRQINLARTYQANLDDLAAHATNGFALLLAILTGKQLLPSNEREKRGIPTITGEAKHNKKKNIEYHNEWQNFVSTVCLQSSDPELRVLNKYADYSCGKFSYDYDAFKKKFFKILEVKKLPSQFDDEAIISLYKKLSDIKVITFGDGIGYAKNIQIIRGENKYERMNIRAIVIPDEHIELFQNIFNAAEVQDIGLITRSEFHGLRHERKEYRDRIYQFIRKLEENFCDSNIKDIPQDSNLEEFVKVYGYDNVKVFIEKFGGVKLKDFTDYYNNYERLPHFSKDFVKTFGSKIPCSFYRSSKEVTIDKEMKYKNPDKSVAVKKVQITYSIPPVETKIIPGSVVNYNGLNLNK